MVPIDFSSYVIRSQQFCKTQAYWYRLGTQKWSRKVWHWWPNQSQEKGESKLQQFIASRQLV